MPSEFSSYGKKTFLNSVMSIEILQMKVSKNCIQLTVNNVIILERRKNWN